MCPLGANADSLWPGKAEWMPFVIRWQRKMHFIEVDLRQEKTGVHQVVTDSFLFQPKLKSLTVVHKSEYKKLLLTKKLVLMGSIVLILLLSFLGK